ATRGDPAGPGPRHRGLVRLHDRVPHVVADVRGQGGGAHPRHPEPPPDHRPPAAPPETPPTPPPASRHGPTPSALPAPPPRARARGTCGGPGRVRQAPTLAAHGRPHTPGAAPSY